MQRWLAADSPQVPSCLESLNIRNLKGKVIVIQITSISACQGCLSLPRVLMTKLAYFIPCKTEITSWTVIPMGTNSRQ